MLNNQDQHSAGFCVIVLILPCVVCISKGLYSATTLDNGKAGYTIANLAHL